MSIVFYPSISAIQLPDVSLSSAAFYFAWYIFEDSPVSMISINRVNDFL